MTTKIHVVVDALGNPVALSLTPGQAADITQAEPLLEGLEAQAVIADKGYDSDNLVERFFNKIKHYRAIATRFDKLASTFLAGLLLVCVLLWLK